MGVAWSVFVSWAHFALCRSWVRWLAQDAADYSAHGPGEARPQEIPASNFAKRSEFSFTRLSPDGRAIALHVDTRLGKFLAVLDASDHSLQRRYTLNESDDVEWIRWAGNTKLLVSLSKPGDWFGEEAGFTRLLLIDMSAGTVELLGNDEPVIEGDDVIFVAEDGSYALVSVQHDVRDYPRAIAMSCCLQTHPRAGSAARGMVVACRQQWRRTARYRLAARSVAGLLPLRSQRGYAPDRETVRDELEDVSISPRS